MKSPHLRTSFLNLKTGLLQLKRTVSRDFQHYFCLKDSTAGPHMNRQKCVTKFFVFAKIFVLFENPESEKSTTILNCCYLVCKHTQVLFSPDCSFKICEKPSEFSQKCSRSHCRVCVVVDYANTVSRVVNPCLCPKWLYPPGWSPWAWCMPARWCWEVHRI